jgi:hypothetical protein
MIERIRNKRIATLAVLALAGCGNTVEGIGNVPMVHCGSHGTPRSNGEDIQDIPKGEQIQMGNAIVTNNKGNYPATGDFAVTSDGDGNFAVTIQNGNNNKDAAIINGATTSHDAVTVSDNGELYNIVGTPGPLGSTALNVTVSCA